jgi:23S rRNA pseudouridine2605 synthase
MDTMRVQRALARAGVASRRGAEELVAAGRVSVNGSPAHIGQVVAPARDRIAVDGVEIERAPREETWLAVYKPAGVMTTRHDPQGRETVFDLVPPVPGLTYAGRLDYLTEGLVLLTTDGELAHRLTHPSAQVERVYEATVRGNAHEAADRARAGVDLEDGPVRAAWVQVKPLGQRRWLFEVAIREGRHREVRRLCAALGLEVERLVRVQFGPVRLGKLAPGGSRPLSGRERLMLEELRVARASAEHGREKPPTAGRNRRPTRGMTPTRSNASDHT